MANKTYQQLLGEAREILQDVNTDPTLHRYPDQTLLDIFNRGLQEVYRTRLDAFYDLWSDSAEDFIVPVIDSSALPSVTSWANPFGLAMMFYGPLVDWIVGYTSTIDDEFNEDSRSIAFIQSFNKRITSL